MPSSDASRVPGVSELDESDQSRLAMSSVQKSWLSAVGRAETDVARVDRLHSARASAASSQ